MSLTDDFLRGLKTQNANTYGGKSNRLTSDFVSGLKKKKKDEEDEIADIAPVRETRASLGDALASGITGLDPLADSPMARSVVTAMQKEEDEDEAPWWDGWFQKGASDKDIAKAILGTLADVGEDFTTGIVGMGEKIVDAGAWLAPIVSKSQYIANGGGLGFNQEQDKLFEEQNEAAKKEMGKFIAKDLYDEQKVARSLLSNLYASGDMKTIAENGGMYTDEDLARFRKQRSDANHYMLTRMEKDSMLAEKSDSLVQSAGQLAGTAALTAMGIPSDIVIGLTSFGSEAENALKQGATYEEAGLSATISAGAEILSEKISGGIKFGGKTLDDGATKWLARNISNKAVRTGLKLGMDMVGEGAEEIISGYMGAIGQKLTYMSEKEMSELFSSEDAWESFIGGAVLGGVGSVTQAAKGKITGVDAVTELTKNEQKVVDKLYEDALAEAEKKGKVTQKEKAKIYDKVLEDMDKGYISTETIEEVLGDRSAYDSLEKESKEFDTLFNTATGQLSKAQQNRLAELEAKNKENPYKDALKTTKEQYSKSVFDMVKGDRLSESYREKDRVYQDFEADFDKYKGTKHEDAARKTLESAMKAGANNTNRVHDIVDMAAHISADTGRTFEFKSGEQITEDFIARQTKEIAKLEKIPEAKRTAEQSEMLTELKDLLAKVESGDVVVDGDITSNGIVLNLDSSKPLNRTVGHEITHSFEPEKGKTSKEYTELKESLFAYAKSKGIDIDKELKTRELMYKGVTDANPEAELVADLVGDFLFTDSDYVSKLSAENRNVFQKMWDKIKYLCKVATAGSQEARELERVKKAFEDAYRAGGKANNTNYSLAMVEAVQPKSNKWSRTLTTDEVKEKFPDLWDVAADESEVRNPTQISGTVKSYRKIYDHLKAEGFDGTILDASSGLGYGTKAGVEEYGFNVEDIEPYPDKSYNPKYTDYSTLDKKYDAIISNAVLNVLPQDQRDALVVKMGEMLNDGGRIFVNVRGSDVKNASSKVAINEDLMEYYIAQSGSYQKGFKTAELVAYLQDTLGDGFTVEPTKMFGAVSAVVTKNGTAKYSLSDSDGRQLTKEQQEYFKDSKMRDENGNLKVMYHGSQDAGFHVFDSKFSDDDTSFFFVDRNDVAASYSGTFETYEAKAFKSPEDANSFFESIGKGEYFVDEKNGKYRLRIDEGASYYTVAESESVEELYTEFCDYEGVGYGDANYKVYLNLTNPLVVDAEGRNWDNVTREFSQEIADRYHSLTDEEKATLSNLASFGDVREFRREINKAMDLVESRGGGDGYTTRLASAYKKLNLDDGKVNIYDLFSIAEDDFSDLAIEAWAVQQMTTRDYAQKAKAEGYDGVIFKNIHDNGGYSNGSEGASTVAIAFDSNQIKSTANAQPTADPDIRYSLSSMANTFFGDENMTAEQFKKADYRQTQGYKDYVDQCLNNYRQTRADFDEVTARKAIEDSVDGIVQVAIAAKQAGYDIYDDATKRSKTDSKNRLLFSSLEPNSDYFTSNDISTICDKRKNFADIYDDIVRAEEAKGVPKGKRFFDNVDNYFAIHKIMADKGLTTPCRQCYVESMRKNLAPMANAFLRLVQETDPNNRFNDQLYHQKGKQKGEQKTSNASTREFVLSALVAHPEYNMSVNDLTVETLTTAEGLAQLKLQAPLVYEAFNSFYGQSKPKMPKGATPFRFGELTALLTDEKGKIKKSLLDKINSTGGFRLQSYSDFQIQNYTDVLQVLFEAGTLGLNGHAYTKVPAFLDATEGTNLKRNISIFMYKDGDEWKLDKNDSFPYDLEEIYELVKADKSGNTGIIAVSQNADMSAWIMANDYVGYGIPFHKSGLKMGTVRDTEVKTEDGRVIKGYSGTIDHTKQQTEVWAKAADDHKALTKVKKGINIYSFWDFDNKANLSKNELIEKNIKAYIDQCELAGYLPKFRAYVMNNGKVLQDVLKYSKELGFVGEDATIEDISFQYKGYTIPYGYYKFLGDFGMFAPDGKASAQKTLSLETYDFDKAVQFFSDAETLRRNEILQQFANGEERQKYKDSDLTAGELQDIVKRKRSEVAKSVVGDLAPAMSMTEQGKQFAPIGNFDVYGKDFRVQNPMQDDVAPSQEAVEDSPVADTPVVVAENETTTEELFPDDISPVQDLEQLMAEEAEMRSVMEAYASVGDIEAVNKLIPEYEAIRERIRDLEADENQRADSLTDEDAPPEMEAPYYSERGETDLTKKATADIVRDVRASLGLTNPQMADAKDIIERYRSGEIQTKEQLVDALQDKFGTATESVEDYVLQEVKRELRTRKLNVTKDIQRGIADYADLMRRNRGRIRFSKEGLAVDELYQEMSDAYPHYFPAEIFNPEDQLLQMIDVANMPHIQQTQRPRDIENIEETADIIINGISDFQYRQDMALSERDARGAFDNLVKNARKYAPPMTAPIQTAPLKQATADTDPAPIFESKDKDAVKGQQTMFEPPKPNPKVANVLTEETAIQKEKSGIGLKLASALVDKGMVFENLSLEKGNHEIQAKWNYALPTNTEARAQYFMEHGADGVKPLKDIKKTVEKSGKTYEFFDYLYHVHNIDRMTLEDRFNDTPNKTVFGETITADVSRAKAAEYEKANPEFKAWAKDIYAFNKHLRSLLVKNGLISQETADLWEKMYPHYVPIRRVDSEGQNISVPLDSRKTGVNNPVKRATGGSSDIMPLFETMALRTEQTFRAIARNSFGVELKNTLGTTIEAQKNAAGVDEMIDTIEAQEDHLLKPGGWNSNPTFTVFENGEKVEFEITEDMYNALKPADGVLAHRSKAIGKVGDLRRNLLTVWNPVFALYRNPIKDIQDVAVNSQHAVKTYLNVPNAIIQMATGGKYATEYHQSGGKSNTYFDSRTNKFKKEDNWFKKTIGLPVRAIETAGEFIEEIPRLAEYIASRKSGRSVERSMLDAARVTTNFAAGGDFTKFLNSHGFTFLNASVQGASQHVRNFREATKQDGLKGFTRVLAKYVIAGLPSILLNSLLWDDDEEYEELSDYVKQNYYVVAKTEDGKFVRIPKGRTSAVMGELMGQMQNLVTGDDEADFSTFYELFWNNIAPSNPIENNILAPIMQVAKNEAWYGGDLVPGRLQDLPAEEQFDESTDSISKWLGEKTGFSPYKINYLLDQYSGGLGDVFLPMLTPEAESGDNSALGNFLAPWKKEMTTDKVLNNQNPGDFYDLKDELEVMSNSKNATEEDKMKSMYMDSVSWEMGDLYAQKREIQSSDLSDSEKYETVREIQEQINELAKTAMAGYNDVTIDGLYSEVGNKRYNKDAESGKWYEIREKNSDGTDNYYYQKEQKVTKALGISYSEYWNNREEYDYAYDKPEQYTLAQAVGGYQSYRSYISELWDIKADKDENGKSISGSRKEKVIDYLNEMDIDYYTKIILFKNEYNADDTYNVEIIEYLNGREDISYKEMETILKYLGFEVDADGNIYW